MSLFIPIQFPDPPFVFPPVVLSSSSGSGSTNGNLDAISPTFRIASGASIFLYCSCFDAPGNSFVVTDVVGNTYTGLTKSGSSIGNATCSQWFYCLHSSASHLYNRITVHCPVVFANAVIFMMATYNPGYNSFLGEAAEAPGLTNNIGPTASLSFPANSLVLVGTSTDQGGSMSITGTGAGIIPFTTFSAWYQTAYVNGSYSGTISASGSPGAFSRSLAVAAFAP